MFLWAFRCIYPTWCDKMACLGCQICILHTLLEVCILVLLHLNEDEIILFTFKFNILGIIIKLKSTTKKSSPFGEDFTDTMRAANNGLYFYQPVTIKASVVLDVKSHQSAWHWGSNPGLTSISSTPNWVKNTVVLLGTVGCWRWWRWWWKEYVSLVSMMLWRLLLQGVSFLFSKEVWQNEGEIWNARVAWVDVFIPFYVCKQYVYYFVTS